jgi:hypothetical protein
MRGSHPLNPVLYLALALLGAAAFAVTPAAAADAVGPPTSLLPPSLPTTAAAPQPQRSVASVASPGKRAALPVQRAPLDGRPLIPPAALPAKLGPPPEPRPALPLETDLQPLAPASSATPEPGAAGEAPSTAAKPPAS